MTILLLFLSSVISATCGWYNYVRAERYKKQRNEARLKLQRTEYREIHEQLIMIRPDGVFYPTRQN